MKVLLAVFFVIAAAAGSALSQGSMNIVPEKAAHASVVGIETLYLAKDNGKGKAGTAVTSFVTTDVPIYCVVQLDSFRSVTVKMILIAVDVPGVDAETQVVAVSYKTNGMQDRVNFEGKPNGNWVAGKYRADVYIDDKKAETITFDIEKTAVRPSASPATKRAARTSERAAG